MKKPFPPLFVLQVIYIEETMLERNLEPKGYCFLPVTKRVLQIQVFSFGTLPSHHASQLLFIYFSSQYILLGNL